MHPLLLETHPSKLPDLKMTCSPSRFLSRSYYFILQKLPDTAPGLDGIPYSFLKRSPTKPLKYFLSLINHMYCLGSVPSSWKDQIIIPVLKQHKDPNDHTSYRPIALSSTISKTAEHLIKNRLDWYMENQKILPPVQFGFRKGKSVTDCHSILTTDIRSAFSSNATVVAAFIDISAAYDNVPISVLRSKLLQLSLPCKLVQFICNMLNDRKIHLLLNGSLTDRRNVWKGLPQGSVLSPILFNIFTHDIHRKLTGNCQMIQYADDMCIYTSHKSIPVAASVLTKCLISIGTWIEEHGLEISAHKSSVAIFSRKKNIPPVTVKYRDEFIPICNTVRFLGLTLDSHLKWTAHVDTVVDKCEKNINLLRTLSGTWWGAHPYSQKLLYNALIRSILDFGSIMLEPCDKKTLSRLDKIQVKALRVVLGAMKSSPNRALQVESVEPPLHLRRQYLADRFLFKVSHIKSNLVLTKLISLKTYMHSKYWRNKNWPCLLRSLEKITCLSAPAVQSDVLPIYETAFNALCHVPKIVKDIGLNENFDINSNFLNTVSEKWPGWYTFFTDASKLNSNSNVGAAFLNATTKVWRLHKLPVEASVFSGECIAILSCITHILEKSINPSVIFTDSLSALQAISGHPFKTCIHNHIICKIKECLLRCHNSNIIVELAWVPAHVGIKGNEYADDLAKKATLHGDNIFFYNTMTDILSIAKKTLFRDWSTEWESFKYKYSIIQPTIPHSPWFFKYRNLNKSTTSILIRMRLGHVCSPVQLFKFKVRNTAICDCGSEEGTVDHIFFNCILNNNCDSLYTLLKNIIPFPINMNFLLTLPSKKVVYSLASFIDTNNIKL